MVGRNAVDPVFKEEREKRSSTLGEALGRCVGSILGEGCEEGFALGARTGFDELDRLLLGLRPGELVIVGSRPGVGKSAFVHNVALNMAKSGLRVLVASTEMRAGDVACRMACAEARISLSSLRAGVVCEAEISALRDARDMLDGLGMVIMDGEGMGADEIAESIGSERIDVVVVDNLQMLDPGEAAGRYLDRRVEVDGIVRDLKRTARLFNVPVIATSQVNRASSKKDARPSMSSFRESGEIEHTADVVILIDRSADLFESRSPDRPDFGLAELLVAKNRKGETGDLWLKFEPSQARYLDHLKDG